RLTKLVYALLDISRIEGGALRLEREWCDLAEIVHTAFKQVAPLAERHCLCPDLETSLPLVQGDLVQLERVFVNLLENAIKYAPAGTEIRARVERRGSEVWASVADEGCGVPVEERERIFQKFYRIKQWRANAARAGAATPAPLLEVGGSGLGLA